MPERVVLGFYGLLPLSQFTSAHSFFVDEREQYFSNSLHQEMYSDRMTAPSLALGLGVQVVRGLSLGAAVTLSLRNEAGAGTFVGNADALDRTLLLSTDVGVKVALAPHFGINYDISDRVHVSGTVHTVERFDIITGFSTFLPNGNKQTAVRHAVHDYQPVRIGLGAAWDVASDGVKEPSDTNELSLHAGALLGLWSNYVDRQNERPTGDYAWQNTFSFVIGARHSYGPVRSFLDASYVPTPVPLQTGRSNYVDNDRISAGAGFDVEFELAELHFRVGAQAQLHMLLSRYQKKLDPAQGRDTVRDEFPDDAVDNRSRPIPSAAGLQTNNPGWPGFSSSGFLVGGAINLAVLL
jgi:long-chain fatty acid transport protein